MIRNPDEPDQPFVPALSDTRCLVTTDAIMLDGANSVCGASRHPELWHPWLSVAIFCVAASCMAAAAIASRRDRSRVPALLLIVSLLASLPGLGAVLVTRADAPGRVGSTAARVSAFLDVVTRFTAGHRVIAVTNACLACQGPLLFVDRGRLPECRTDAAGTTTCLVPPNQRWADPDGRLDLAPSALDGGCAVSQTVLTCGH